MLREAQEEKFRFPNPKEEKTIIFLEWCVAKTGQANASRKHSLTPIFFYFGLKHRHEALPSPFSPLALLRKAAEREQSHLTVSRRAVQLGLLRRSALSFLT